MYWFSENRANDFSTDEGTDVKIMESDLRFSLIGIMLQYCVQGLPLIGNNGVFYANKLQHLPDRFFSCCFVDSKRRVSG